MSRDVNLEATQLADIAGTLEKVLKELRKMNFYLALMKDIQIEDEDEED